MNIILYIILALFVFGSLFGFLNKKIGYIFALCASVLSLYFAVVSKSLISGEYNVLMLTNKISLGFNTNNISDIFLMIASLSWIAISIYSIDFGTLYKRRMATFLNLTMLGMFIILVANDGVMFLIGWELMTIMSYLLITEHAGSYKEAFQFLAFGELSTVLLVISFANLFTLTGSFVLAHIYKDYSMFLILASIAFLIKMGILPFHIWLKEAHSKAPSNASALLSAPITLMGIYGIVRILSMVPYSQYWGIISLILGAISAFWGALQAASAKGIKTLPAYSTIENNGMILSAIGLSVLAGSVHQGGALTYFSLLTAVILSLSHVLSKTLLFLSIGHAKEQLGEEDINNIRGIHRSVGKIPALGILISGLSLSAFPPLIGFVAEWMILESIFQSYKFMSMSYRLISSVSGVLIALAIGFSAFSMIKLIGYSALGFHHNKKVKNMQTYFMKISECFLIILIIGSGMGSAFLARYFVKYNFVSGLLGIPNGFLLISARPIFGVLSPMFFVIICSVIFIIPFILYIKNTKKVKKVSSWNGGLSLKENEYFTTNAYSFIIEHILKYLYMTKEIKNKKYATVQIQDVFDNVYAQIIRVISKFSYNISTLIMNGKVYLYIIYIFITFCFIFILFH